VVLLNPLVPRDAEAHVAIAGDNDFQGD
jgi:hypothetical protein